MRICAGLNEGFAAFTSAATPATSGALTFPRRKLMPRRLWPRLAKKHLQTISPDGTGTTSLAVFDEEFMNWLRTKLIPGICVVTLSLAPASAQKTSGTLHPDNVLLT